MNVKVAASLFLGLSPFSSCSGEAVSQGSTPAPQQSAASPAPDPLVAVPLESLAEAGVIEGEKSPMDQAKQYDAEGRVWLARLVLEKKALGKEGKPEEIAFLKHLCEEQQDNDCIDACVVASGGKVKRSKDAGAKQTTLGMAEELVKKGKVAQARKLIEPEVLSGSAPAEEIQLLKMVCTKQKDKTCVALCDAKLK